MNLKQTTLAASVMVALVASNANAAVFIGKAGGQTNTPAKFAVEQPTETSGKFFNPGGVLDVYVPSVGGYTVNASNTLFFKIALKGGAKFTKVPSLECRTITAATFKTAVITNGGAAGSTQVTFSVKTGLVMNSTSAVCRLKTYSGAAAVITAVYTLGAKTAQTISAVVEYNDGLANVSKSYTGTFITFAQALAAKIQAAGLTNTATNAVIDVKEASKKFVVAAPTTTTTTALVGSVSYNAANSPATAANSKSGVALTPANVITTATITISGPVNGAAKFGLDADQCNGGGAPLYSVAPSGGTVTFSSVTPAQIAAGLNVCMYLNGTNVLDAGQLTLQLSGKAVTTPGTWVPVFGDAQNIHLLKKNGSSYRVLNIPNPTNGDQAFIRLYNPNNFETIVRGTMYSQDGAQLGTTQILDPAATGTSLKPYEVRIITAPNLATLFGVTTWTGRARLVVDAEADKFQVQALMRGPSQVLVNMSGQTSAE